MGLPPLLFATVSRSARTQAQKTAGSRVCMCTSRVGEALMFWAIGRVNAEDDHCQCAESRAGYEHDYGSDQDEGSHGHAPAMCSGTMMFSA